MRRGKTRTLGVMDRPRWVTNEGDWLRDCQEVVRVSRAILEGAIDLLEGMRILFHLQFPLRAEEDPDFRVVTGFYSETDSFPVGVHRIRWHAGALDRVDQQRLEIESRWKVDIEAACNSLIAKYQDAQST
jgi:hypothetical protein